MNSTEQFCQVIRERSIENQAAARAVYDIGLYGQVVSILRQELDSLVRVIFLLDKDLSAREHYINQTLNKEKWTLPGTRTVVTDKQMVDHSSRLFGWTKSVYKFGCAFIHLSIMPNYKNENPFQGLLEDEIIHIKRHLHEYHSFELGNELNIITIAPYLMPVLDKISSNLRGYISDLEQGR